MMISKSINVHIYVTPVCNIRCKHCYYDAGVTEKREELLTIQQLRDIITELDADYDADFHMEGGELFLREDINELFETIPDDILKHITITTNGTIGLSKHKNYLKKINCLRISVCGHTDEMQKELRGIGLTKVLEVVRYAKEELLPVTLRMTLNKKYYRELLTASIQHYYEKEGIKKFSLYEFQPVGRGKEFEDEYMMDDEDCEHVLQLIKDIQYRDIEIRISFSHKRIDVVKRCEKELLASGYEVIYLNPEESLTIDYDGMIGICPWNIDKKEIGRYTGDIKKVIKAFDLHHTCEYCSVIVVQKKKGEIEGAPEINV